MRKNDHGRFGIESVSRRAMIAGLAAGTGFLTLHNPAAWSQAHKGETGSGDVPGIKLTPQQRMRGADFVMHHPSIDIHAHPGRFFLRGLPEDAPAVRAFGAPDEPQVIADLNAGHVSAALFAAVADMQVLGVSKTGIRGVRNFKPGEAIADYARQIADLRALISHGGLGQAVNVQGVYAAKQRGRTAAIFAVEGGDFIEDRLDRIHRAHMDGVRAITIVHYRVNQIGDIQSEAPVHNGLTPLGKDIVREMNKAGIIVDLAHATFAVTKDVLEISDRPVMLSHSTLAAPGDTAPRLISAKHAAIVADHGGIIGAVPWGFGQSRFSDYIDAILRLVDCVGVRHVAIGTDMDATYKPVFTTYRDWSLIPAALLARGLHESEVGMIMGGNFLRIFRTALAGIAGSRGAAQ